MLYERCRRHGFEIAVAALYLVVFAFLLQRHELWRDEIQAWLIARDSASVADLFHNLRYEGHPGLWHLLLMPLTRISWNPLLMQWFHAALAFACVLVVVFASPLTRLERALFPFGYFPLALYGVVNRSYILGFLLAVLICTVWRRRGNPVLLSVLLALLANVHILFAIVALAFCLALVVDRAGARRKWDWRDGLAVAIFASGFALAIATAVPAADVAFSGEWYFGLSGERAGRAFRVVAALVGRRTVGGAVIALPIFLFFAYRLRSSLPALVFLLTAVGGVVSFFYLRHLGWFLHYGVVYVAFFAAIWIHRLDQPHPGFAFRAVFGLVLTLHVIAASSFVRGQAGPAESYAGDVARFIEERGWKADPLIGESDAETATVVGCLGIPRAYYLNVERWGSFALWDRRPRLDPSEAMHALARAPIAAGSAATLLLENPVDVGRLVPGFVEVARFDTPSSRQKENFVVYRREATPAN